jgi:hypothetical protein
VIAQVVRPRQPDTPVKHCQLATQTAQMGRIGMQLKSSAMKQLELRIHHQSPALGLSIIGYLNLGIQ